MIVGRVYDSERRMRAGIETFHSHCIFISDWRSLLPFSLISLRSFLLSSRWDRFTITTTIAHFPLGRRSFIVTLQITWNQQIGCRCPKKWSTAPRSPPGPTSTARPPASLCHVRNDARSYTNKPLFGRNRSDKALVSLLIYQLSSIPAASGSRVLKIVTESYGSSNSYGSGLSPFGQNAASTIRWGNYIAGFSWGIVCSSAVLHVARSRCSIRLNYSVREFFSKMRCESVVAPAETEFISRPVAQTGGEGWGENEESLFAKGLSNKGIFWDDENVGWDKSRKRRWMGIFERGGGSLHALSGEACLGRPRSPRSVHIPVISDTIYCIRCIASWFIVSVGLLYLKIIVLFSRDSREREKKEIMELNDKLANYIENVQFFVFSSDSLRFACSLVVL